MSSDKELGQNARRAVTTLDRTLNRLLNDLHAQRVKPGDVVAALRKATNCLSSVQRGKREGHTNMCAVCQENGCRGELVCSKTEKGCACECPKNLKTRSKRTNT